MTETDNQHTSGYYHKLDSCRIDAGIRRNRNESAMVWVIQKVQFSFGQVCQTFTV